MRGEKDKGYFHAYLKGNKQDRDRSRIEGRRTRSVAKVSWPFRRSRGSEIEVRSEPISRRLRKFYGEIIFQLRAERARRRYLVIFVFARDIVGILWKDIVKLDEWFIVGRESLESVAANGYTSVWLSLCGILHWKNDDLCAENVFFPLSFFFSYRLRAKLVCTSNIWDINSHIIRSYLNKSYFKISLDSTRQVKREYLKKSNATTTIPWRYESHRISITRISSRLLLQLDLEENASNNSSNGK